jgi:hypothetical protein
MSASSAQIDGITKRRKSQASPSSVKLPYLRPSKPMTYFQEETSHSSSPARKDFNLFINHAKMPEYDAALDKNCGYFFDKTVNRKLLEDLREAEKSKSKRRASSKTDKNISQLQKSWIGREAISKLEFQNYLSKMKARIAHGIGS